MFFKSDYNIFVPLIKENQDKFYRFAYNYVRDREVALDLVQDAIVKALQKISTLKHEEFFKSWFYKILMNECLTYIRKQKKVQFSEIDENITSKDYADNGIEAHDLMEAIMKLEPEMRTIIFLRFYENMKLSEIAFSTNANLNTVKTRLYNALSLLKDNIGEEYLNM